MAQTAQDIVVSALRSINAYQPTDQLNDSDLSDCLERLNDLLDSWSTGHQFVFGTSEYVLQWVNGQKQYKIGNPTCTDLGEAPFTGTLTKGGATITGVTNIPSDLVIGATLTDTANVIPAGTTVTAVGTNTVTMSANATATPSNGVDTITYTVPGDFAIARPLRITGGYTRINQLDFWLDVYTSQDEYNAILYKFQPGPWPTVAWYNNTFPYGLLNAYQSPGQNAELHLFCDTVLTNLTLDQTIVVPQGYIRALKWSLAEEIWDEYHSPMPVPPGIQKKAYEAREAIKALNAQPPKRSQYDRQLIFGNRIDGGWVTHGGFGTGY